MTWPAHIHRVHIRRPTDPTRSLCGLDNPKGGLADESLKGMDGCFNCFRSWQATELREASPPTRRRRRGPARGDFKTNDFWRWADERCGAEAQ